MKKKKIYLIVVSIILLFALGVGVWFLMISYSFKKRMGFELPQNSVITTIQKDINIKSESVIMKFQISESDLESFLSKIEKAGYIEDADFTVDTIPHPERVCDDFDLDYDNLSQYYYAHCVRNTLFVKYRGSIGIYIVKATDKNVTIYVNYNS